MNIGNRIKVLRIRAGLNQKQLAEKSNLSCSFICQIEKGKHHGIGAESLISLAKALKVKIDQILSKAA